MKTLKRELLSNTNAMRKVRAQARHLHRKLHYWLDSGRQDLGPESAQRAVLRARLTGTQLGNSTAHLASEACEATGSHYST